MDPEVIARAGEGEPQAAREYDEHRLAEAAKPGGGEHRPSMGQDMVKGRRTEIEFLNGFVVRKGDEVGSGDPGQRGADRHREAGGARRTAARPEAHHRPAAELREASHGPALHPGRDSRSATRCARFIRDNLPADTRERMRLGYSPRKQDVVALAAYPEQAGLGGALLAEGMGRPGLDGRAADDLPRGEPGRTGARTARPSTSPCSVRC